MENALNETIYCINGAIELKDVKKVEFIEIITDTAYYVYVYLQHKDWNDDRRINYFNLTYPRINSTEPPRTRLRSTYKKFSSNNIEKVFLTIEVEKDKDMLSIRLPGNSLLCCSYYGVTIGIPTTDFDRRSLIYGILYKVYKISKSMIYTIYPDKYNEVVKFLSVFDTK